MIGRVKRTGITTGAHSSRWNASVFV